MMDRKGISPLIATVLIIGFTVALAAIIITWGGRFIQTTQEDVGRQADLGIACSNLDFDISDVVCKVDATVVCTDFTGQTNCEAQSGCTWATTGCTGTPDGFGPGDDTVNVTIASNANRVISDVIVRVTGPEGVGVDTIETVSIPAFGAKTVTYNEATPNFLTEITEVEVIPKIDLGKGEGPQACTAAIQKYVISTLNAGCK